MSNQIINEPTIDNPPDDFYIDQPALPASVQIIRLHDYDRAAIERAQRQIENLEEFKRQAEQQRGEMEQVVRMER